MTASVYVIDASALLAYLHDEPGGSRVADCLDGALMSSVNLCEVLQKVGISLNVTGRFGDRDRCWKRARTGVEIVNQSVTISQQTA